jgi:uncharacterized protein YkwD
MVATARAASTADDEASTAQHEASWPPRRTRRRRRVLAAAAIATLAIVASACLPAAPPPTVRAAPSVVNEINTHRYPPLAVNDALTNLAADWARHLATTGVMEHRNLGAVGGWTHLGETIVQGACGISDAAVVNLWMNSPPHAQVMLSGAFTSAGVARACAADGREWVVANFGG